MNYAQAIAGLNAIAATELGIAPIRRVVRHAAPDELAWRRKVRWMKAHRKQTGCGLTEAVEAWKQHNAKITYRRDGDGSAQKGHTNDHD